MFCRHTGRIDDRWARFMKFQISRARAYFADAHAGVNLLDENARWPVWSALILYRCVLFSSPCLSPRTAMLDYISHSCQGRALSCPSTEASGKLHGCGPGSQTLPLSSIGWLMVLLCRQILDAIEKNGYDNFNQRAYVRKWRKYASLPAAFVKARLS